ncbi:glutathione S-transferase family protein [Caulobacter segnis]|uniref:glutathione S-transferase family protein n=1 Tax=Caulobacter segnis TaxID=88688 RepID=UPI00240F1FB4|nr:glutathione S-transferase family protein [Caulobacter segnis]MDG2522630.1 glutathione S-transferase family protein [Caulobacter segnis]
MSLTLVLGNKNYSSWSMRAWLLLKTVGAAFDEVMIPIYSDGARDQVRALGGQTGMVPMLKDGDLAVWDTLAIFEYVAERFGGVWPTDPADRARARSYAAEVHAGFNDLRAAMPCNTRARNRRAVITHAVEADIQRVLEIWETAGRRDAPWLFGDFGAADMMFAPIATRFQSFGYELTGRPLAYQQALLSHPLMLEWLAAGEAETDVIEASEIGRG